MRAALGLLLGVFGILSSTSWAAGYSFTNIADSTGPLTFAMSSPSINDSGAVAFTAYYNGRGHNGEAVILMGRGGPLSTVSTPVVAPAQMAFNNQDRVAFIVDAIPGPPAVFSASASDSLHFPGTDSCCAVAVNDDADVAYAAAPTGGVRSVVVSRRGSVEVVGQVPADADVQGVSINKAGTVAYTTNVERGGSKLFVATKHSTASLVAADDHGSFGAPVINNRGAVAFRCGDYSAVCLVDHKGKYVAIGSGKFDFLAGDPSMNDAGVIAYWGVKQVRDKARIAIYTTAQDAPVISTGDQLFGSTVTQLVGVSGTYLNNRGQIAFQYELADGRTGVARADPLR